MPAIVTLRRDQLEASSAVLARAFDDDPVFRYLYPTPRRRRWSCRSFLHAIARDGLPFGEVWAAVDNGAVVGTAGWLPEGSYPPSRRRAARQLAAAWQALLTPHTFRAGLRYLTETEKLHPKAPHWYLAVIGVEPARQGEGLGGKLLSAVLDGVALPGDWWPKQPFGEGNRRRGRPAGPGASRLSRSLARAAGVTPAA